MPEILKAKVRVFIELSQMRRQVALQAEERARRDAAEEASQSSAFLATVSESLARSQSHAELLRSLVMLPIPPLADVTIAWLKDDETCLDLTEWHRATLETMASRPILSCLTFLG